MKIAFFSTSVRFSGGRLAMFRHANALADRGHDVSIWIQDVQPTIDWIEVEVPIRSFHPASLHTLPAADVCVFDRTRLAASLLRAGLGRVVHLCQGFEGTDAELRIRDAWTRRGVFGLTKIWRLQRRLREIDRAYRLPTLKIVTHRHLGDLIARRFGQHTHFVPCGLPPGVFTPPVQRSAQARIVLVVGPTDIRWKRVADALRAVQLLKRTRPEVRLVRVAQHPMRELEAALGVADEYYSMLRPSEMAALYSRADVLLITSDATEGFGLPVLEAMACGLPCVVTDIPAFRTFARPDDYARFVPVGDPQRMAAAVEHLLDSGEERRHLSLRGVEVAAGYTMQRSYDAMEHVLSTIVSGSSRSGPANSDPSGVAA
jgi:glycosyltransferase involved in cell wall biosynthesis